MNNRDDDSTSKKRPTIEEMIEKSLAHTREKKEREAHQAAELAAVRAGARADRDKHDILAMKQFIHNVITAKPLDYLYREIEPDDCIIFSYLRKASQGSSGMSEHQREGIVMLLHKCVSSFIADDVEMLTDFLKKAEKGQYPLLSRLPENENAFRVATSIPDILVTAVQQRVEYLRPGPVEAQRSTKSKAGFFEKPRPVTDKVEAFKQDHDEREFRKSLYGIEPKKLESAIKKPRANTKEGTMDLMRQCHSLNQVISFIRKIKSEECRNALLGIVGNRSVVGKHPTEYLTAVGAEILKMQSDGKLDKHSLQQVKKMAQEIDRTCGITILDILAKATPAAEKAVTRVMKK